MVTRNAISIPECICMAVRIKDWIAACTHALIYSVVLHRYPVHYVRDVPEGEPQRVWLFDEPIVIARRPGITLMIGNEDTVCASWACSKAVRIRQ